MDQKSPGHPCVGSVKVPGGTPGDPDAILIKRNRHLRIQDLTSPSTNPPSNSGLETKASDISIGQSKSSTDSTFYSALHHGSSSDFTQPSRDGLRAGYLNQAQGDGLSQRVSTHDGILKEHYQPEVGFAQHRNVTAPATSRPSKHENRQQLKCGGESELIESGPTSMPTGEGHGKADMPNWSNMRREYDRHELFLFEDKRSCDTARNGAEAQVS